MESHLEKEAAKRALEKLYTERAGNEKENYQSASFVKKQAHKNTQDSVLYSSIIIYVP